MSDKDVIDAIDLRLPENRKFSFAWITNLKDGALITRPDLTSITVSSEPGDLLRSNSPPFRSYEEDYWHVIDINVNPAFVNSIAENKIEQVKVSIKFQTKFGEEKSLDFVGIVF